jgi:hypothetical protein
MVRILLPPAASQQRTHVPALASAVERLIFSEEKGFQVELGAHPMHAAEHQRASRTGWFEIRAAPRWREPGFLHRRSASLENERPQLGDVVPALIVVVKRKSYFEGDLVVRRPAVFDMAARLHHLEPAELAQRARGATNGVLDRILDALLGGTSDLDDPVNVIGHRHPSFGSVMVDS